MADYDDLVGPLPVCSSGSLLQLPIPGLRETSSKAPSLREMVLEAVKPGDLVVRGPHWQRGEEDGGAGRLGVVVAVEADGVLVSWRDDEAIHKEAAKDAVPASDPGAAAEIIVPPATPTAEVAAATPSPAAAALAAPVPTTSTAASAASA